MEAILSGAGLGVSEKPKKRKRRTKEEMRIQQEKKILPSLDSIGSSLKKLETKNNGNVNFYKKKFNENEGVGLIFENKTEKTKKLEKNFYKDIGDAENFLKKEGELD